MAKSRTELDMASLVIVNSAFKDPNIKKEHYSPICELNLWQSQITTEGL